VKLFYQRAQNKKNFRVIEKARTRNEVSSRGLYPMATVLPIYLKIKKRERQGTKRGTVLE
jgi:hypothetical protein